MSSLTKIIVLASILVQVDYAFSGDKYLIEFVSIDTSNAGSWFLITTDSTSREVQTPAWVYVARDSTGKEIFIVSSREAFQPEATTLEIEEGQVYELSLRLLPDPVFMRNAAIYIRGHLPPFYIDNRLFLESHEVVVPLYDCRDIRGKRFLK
jgi:hypothetical protein